MSDVWTALLEGITGFGHTRAAEFVGDSFHDAGSFIGTLAEDRSITPDVKARFEKLKQDITNEVAVIKPLVELLKPKFAAAKTAVQNVATELGTSPFTIEAAARAATELAYVLAAYDEAMQIVAKELSKDEHGTVQPAIQDAIAGIDEPWKKAFRNLAAGAGDAFDAVAKQLLDVDHAISKLEDHLSFDRAGKELKLEFAKVTRKTLGPVSLEQTTLVGFLNYKTKAALGVRLRTKLQAGLRSDKLLEKVIPNGADPAAESTMISLDTDRGLSFGDGKNKKLTLPVNFSFPGVELREFAIGEPSEGTAAEKDGKLEITATVATKLGDAVGIVVEGTGVVVAWKDAAGNDRLDISPRLPTGLGVRVNAGIVSGGGFIRRADKEYSGILDLKVGEFRITAIGMLVTDPFSFVVIMSVHFSPTIELGLGFTLNGLGGILAVDRRVSTDELRKGIRDGTAATLLFPENPIDSATKILDKVRAVFPPQEGAFAVGPIAELGWGSQTGFVLAKIGIVLSLPDPKIILLGALQVAVPSTKVPDKLKIVDLHAEIYGEFTPDYLLILIGISNSKLASISISGDLGLFIRWAGEPDFALSVGGFFPGFLPPAELAGMRPITINMSPMSWLSLKITAYFAVTANSIQFGGGIFLDANLEVAEGKAWLTLDALFKWSPRFYFEVRISAGLSISVLGEDLLGVDFKGTLKGTTPWSIEGHASIHVLFWTVHFDLGPTTWGDPAPDDTALIEPAAVVAQALSEPSAWIPQLPAGGDTLVRLTTDTDTPLLVHPLGGLEVKQLKVPLETRIDRIGSTRVSANRVNLASPAVAGVAANVVSHAVDRFAPGHFIELTDDQQVSRPAFETMPAGMRVGATAAPSFGPSSSVAVEWETCFPHEQGLKRVTGRSLFTSLLRDVALRASPVAIAARSRSNPYQGRREPIHIGDPADREVRRTADLAVVAGAAGRMTFTAAAERIADLGQSRDAELELIAAGVAS